MYTLNQVATHNSSGDCWMVINQNVYDVTSYLASHDDKLDIRSWCGTDATNDYNTKAGQGQSHSDRADSLLNQYLIGTLDTTSQTSSNAITTTPVATPNIAKSVVGYNILVPVLATIILYFASLKFLQRATHNLIWNSVMVLGLIPSFGFGVALILGNRGLLYSHVEFSLVFGTACVLHFLLRFKVYLAQVKMLRL